MDPLTALGITSNVVQLLDFTFDFFRLANRIYHNYDSSQAIPTELLQAGDRLKELSLDLPLQHSDVSATDSYDATTKALITSSGELWERASRLARSIQSYSRPGRLESIKLATKLKLWKAEIEDLRLTVERLRRSLNTELLATLGASMVCKLHISYWN